jgi:hypothetical protein
MNEAAAAKVILSLAQTENGLQQTPLSSMQQIYLSRINLPSTILNFHQQLSGEWQPAVVIPTIKR